MSGSVLFRQGGICTPEGLVPEGWLLVREGRIALLGTGEAPPDTVAGAQVIDLDGRILAPGLIDVHTHGALGCDTMDADPASLRTMAAFYARHGVTGFLATTMTASLQEIKAALDNVAAVMTEGTGGAALLGAHLEGPYLNPAYAGAQSPEFVVRADLSGYAPLFASGVVRLVTLAPEFPENHALIAFARARGTVVSIGHSGADYAAALEAVSLGVSHVTHLYNAMSPLNHRQPGMVGAALASDALTCELIADLVHVHPAVLALTLRLKDAERIALVTDAMSGTGMPDGDYTLGGLPVTVTDGVARGANGALAGSTLTLERAVANMMQATGQPLETILPMASRVPARMLGLPKGDIAAGLDADLIVLGSEGQEDLTMVGGQVVWQR